MKSPEKNIELKKKYRQKIYIASGSTHPELAGEIAEHLGLELGDDERKQFPNTEQFFKYGDSVRGYHVFAIQSLAASKGRSVNDSLMELMLMVDAAKRASAAEISVVVPYLAYSRQDRKARGREPISVATVINMLQNAGANRLVAADLHSQQSQAIFDGPFDTLMGEPLIADALKEKINGNNDEFVVVSPDEGRAKGSADYAHMLNVDIVNMAKSRDRNDPSKIIRPTHVDGVEGRTAFIIDDMIDTAGTLVSAANILKDSGAKHVIVAATHGIFSGPAYERLSAAPIDEVMVTDTIPLDEAKEALGDKLVKISSSRMIARALFEIATDGSVTKMFNDRNNR